MIFPQPKHEVYHDGVYKLKAYKETQDLLVLYDMYKAGNADVSLVLNEDYGTDEYGITVTEEGITITQSGDCSIFRAVASLKQLLRQYGDAIPCCEIKDSPDFARRAYMLEISCGRMPKVATIKRYIDYLASLKYNEFQLYVENFSVKYSAFPKYTADFDCLTPEDLEELDDYCRERFIDFVPNQNGFGHMSTWLAQDEFKHLDVSGGEVNTATVNPLLPETYEFMDKIYGSLLPHFKSGYVNIGFDEAYGLGKYQLEEVCKEKGEATVFMDYLNKIADLIDTKYHKKVQFWADMIYNHPEAFKRVPEGAIPLAWGYDPIKSAMGEAIFINMESHGTKYYVCPGTSNWMSLTGRFDVVNFNLRTYADAGRKHHAYGYLLTDWGCDDGHVTFPVWSIVPIALAGQYAWNVGEEQNGGAFKGDYVRGAMKFADDTVFHAPVAEWLYKMQQYYLMEPERIFSGTMCFYMLRLPLSQSGQKIFFDLDKCGDNFYFRNVIRYMKEAISELEKIAFDETLKRQALLNARMVILGAEIAMMKIDKCFPAAKIDELVAIIDELSAEYSAVWNIDNYPLGQEIFLKMLSDRKEELLAQK